MALGLKIFDDLNNEKVNYVVWKNIHLIDDFYQGKENLDIYIETKYKKKFQNLLKKHNWLEVKSTTNNIKEIKHYLYFSHDKVFHIHAYFKLFTGNSITKDYDFSTLFNYFEKKFFDQKNNLWILNYDIQICLYYIRLAIKRKSYLGNLLFKRDIKNNKIEINFLLNKFDVKKINYFEINNLNLNLEKITFKKNQHLKKFIIYFDIFKRINFFSSFLKQFTFFINIILKKIFKLKRFKLKNKIYIFISGPDSSGKSTISNDLFKLCNCFIKSKEFSIGKPYPKFLINLLIKKNYFKKQRSIKRNLNEKKSGIVKNIKDLNLSILRYLFSFYIFSFQPHSSIIILDRYLSENRGDINGPRIKTSLHSSAINKIFSKIEVFFYRSSKFINNEYRLKTDLNNCIFRNKNRSKKVKKSTEEIITRYNLFQSSNFKSLKVYELDNNNNKAETIKSILKILSMDVNEVY